ncbi:MAG: MmcB family DNA repair protein [Paracoccaceae bacterium]
MDTAAAISPGRVLARGVCRGLISHGGAALTEVTLSTGLRMDVLSVMATGEIWGVEVKSSRADFTSDAKWPGYVDWCDRFHFAVPEGFPDELLPADAGLLRADRDGAEILRPGPLRRLAAPRRKALILRFARLAADRLARLTVAPDL